MIAVKLIRNYATYAQARWNRRLFCANILRNACNNRCQSSLTSLVTAWKGKLSGRRRTRSSPRHGGEVKLRRVSYVSDRKTGKNGSMQRIRKEPIQLSLITPRYAPPCSHYSNRLERCAEFLWYARTLSPISEPIRIKLCPVKSKTPS